MKSDWCVALEKALVLHRAGDVSTARKADEALLPEAPGDAGLLGLLGVVALQQGRDENAEALLRQSVAAEGEPRIHLRNLNNLLALLQQTGDADGRVVFFEAGATMLFHIRHEQTPADIRLPDGPLHRADDAFRALVASRIAGGPGVNPRGGA